MNWRDRTRQRHDFRALLATADWTLDATEARARDRCAPSGRYLKRRTFDRSLRSDSYRELEYAMDIVCLTIQQDRRGDVSTPAAFPILNALSSCYASFWTIKELGHCLLTNAYLQYFVSYTFPMIKQRKRMEFLNNIIQVGRAEKMANMSVVIPCNRFSSFSDRFVIYSSERKCRNNSCIKVRTYK